MIADNSGREIVRPTLNVFVDRRATRGRTAYWGMVATERTKDWSIQCVIDAVRRSCGADDPVSDLMVEPLRADRFESQAGPPTTGPN